MFYFLPNVLEEESFSTHMAAGGGGTLWRLEAAVLRGATALELKAEVTSIFRGNEDGGTLLRACLKSLGSSLGRMQGEGTAEKTLLAAIAMVAVPDGAGEMSNAALDMLKEVEVVPLEIVQIFFVKLAMSTEGEAVWRGTLQAIKSLQVGRMELSRPTLNHLMAPLRWSLPVVSGEKAECLKLGIEFAESACQSRPVNTCEETYLQYQWLDPTGYVECEIMRELISASYSLLPEAQTSLRGGRIQRILCSASIMKERLVEGAVPISQLGIAAVALCDLTHLEATTSHDAAMQPEEAFLSPPGSVFQVGNTSSSSAGAGKDEYLFQFSVSPLGDCFVHHIVETIAALERSLGTLGENSMLSDYVSDILFPNVLSAMLKGSTFVFALARAAIELGRAKHVAPALNLPALLEEEDIKCILSNEPRYLPWVMHFVGDTVPLSKILIETLNTKEEVVVQSKDETTVLAMAALSGELSHNIECDEEGETGLHMRVLRTAVQSSECFNFMFPSDGGSRRIFQSRLALIWLCSSTEKHIMRTSHASHVRFALAFSKLASQLISVTGFTLIDKLAQDSLHSMQTALAELSNEARETSECPKRDILNEKEKAGNSSGDPGWGRKKRCIRRNDVVGGMQSIVRSTYQLDPNLGLSFYTQLCALPGKKYQSCWDEKYKSILKTGGGDRGLGIELLRSLLSKETFTNAEVKSTKAVMEESEYPVAAFLLSVANTLDSDSEAKLSQISRLAIVLSTCNTDYITSFQTTIRKLASKFERGEKNALQDFILSYFSGRDISSSALQQISAWIETSRDISVYVSVILLVSPKDISSDDFNGTSSSPAFSDDDYTVTGGTSKLYSIVQDACVSVVNAGITLNFMRLISIAVRIQLKLPDLMATLIETMPSFQKETAHNLIVQLVQNGNCIEADLRNTCHACWKEGPQICLELVAALSSGIEILRCRAYSLTTWAIRNLEGISVTLAQCAVEHLMSLEEEYSLELTEVISMAIAHNFTSSSRYARSCPIMPDLLNLGYALLEKSKKKKDVGLRAAAEANHLSVIRLINQISQLTRDVSSSAFTSSSFAIASLLLTNSRQVVEASLCLLRMSFVSGNARNILKNIIKAVEGNGVVVPRPPLGREIYPVQSGSIEEYQWNALVAIFSDSRVVDLLDFVSSIDTNPRHMHYWLRKVSL